MQDRGMKKYLPFSSLVEQKEYLDKMLYEKRKIDKPKISTEQAEKINYILKNYIKGEIYNFSLYVDGYLYNYKGTILNINLNKRLIYFKDFYLPINAIINIENNDPFLDIS